ncbi:MAG TPA: ABC transporter permease [Candidatus Sulfotelmatobacter sp.]|nr:ABC transporter permease [Candidatus Sulfotelmatobacter sp.]
MTTEDDASLVVAGAVSEPGVWPEGNAILHSSGRPTRVIGPPAFSLMAVLAGLRTLFQYSDLLYTLSLFRLNIRYKQSILGWAWAALQPLTLMCIYTFIFAHVTTVKTGGAPYPVFVFSALLPWIFFSGAITNAVHGLVTYPNLLTKMYFPREIIPLSYLAASFVDFLIASGILLVLMAHYHATLTWNALYAAPIFLVLAAFTAAVGLFFSAVHVRFRDVGLAMPFALQLWMFAAPVVYSVQSVPARFQKLYLLDPIAVLIENFRRVLVFGTAPDAAQLAFSTGITLVALALAYLYFKTSEATMADVI